MSSPDTSADESNVLPEDGEVVAEFELDNTACEFCQMGVNEDGEPEHWWKSGKSKCPIVKEYQAEKKGENIMRESLLQ